jgi:hypothetical protein
MIAIALLFVRLLSDCYKSRRVEAKILVMRRHRMLWENLHCVGSGGDHQPSLQSDEGMVISRRLLDALLTEALAPAEALSLEEIA